MSIELEPRVEQSDDIQDAMSIIVQELSSLCALVARMKTVYARAAACNDLTFIKIIEEKYHDLWLILKEMEAKAMEEQNRISVELT